MGRGVQTEGSQAMVPLMAWWEVASDPRVTDRCVEDVQAGLDLYPHDQVVWTPYLGEAAASHPAMAAGHPLFDRHLLLLCLGTCEPLYLELVMPESEAVRFLEGRLAEQAVETERLRAEMWTLRDELAWVRASRDTGASSSAQPASRDLAVRLQGALDRAKARWWRAGTTLEGMREDLLTMRGRLLEAREQEREAERAWARIATDYETLKDRVLKKRREQ
ncbi:hypothetical protein Taro_002465 [Colocasia esculenta]|uniref:Uncharacterized protein n=1 Tax=Colocasia esculenta TaxID=4460 RepID=A0A843TCQ0_COLES|nr:hypothetical protein [Colocasia esculenta]